MRLAEFNALGLDKKADHVLVHGVLLSGRSFDAYLIYLYSVDSFFVELWFRKNTVHALFPFSSTQFLEAYLKEVSLSELLG